MYVLYLDRENSPRIYEVKMSRLTQTGNTVSTEENYIADLPARKSGNRQKLHLNSITSGDKHYISYMNATTGGDFSRTDPNIVIHRYGATSTSHELTLDFDPADGNLTDLQDAKRMDMLLAANTLIVGYSAANTCKIIALNATTFDYASRVVTTMSKCDNLKLTYYGDSSRFMITYQDSSINSDKVQQQILLTATLVPVAGSQMDVSSGAKVWSWIDVFYHPNSASFGTIMSSRIDQRLYFNHNHRYDQ